MALFSGDTNLRPVLLRRAMFIIILGYCLQLTHGTQQYSLHPNFCPNSKTI
jgi:hypothetical protein